MDFVTNETSVRVYVKKSKNTGPAMPNSMRVFPLKIMGFDKKPFKTQDIFRGFRHKTFSDEPTQCGDAF